MTTANYRQPESGARVPPFRLSALAGDLPAFYSFLPTHDMAIADARRFAEAGLLRGQTAEQGKKG